MLRFCPVVVIAILLAGCSPAHRPVERVSVERATPPSSDQNYVWARNDGRRMATDPELRRKGEADQQQCNDQASGGGALNLPAFVSCMEGRGYHRRTS